jgi:hypothetical protein
MQPPGIDADIAKPRETVQLAIAVPIALKKRLRRLARDAHTTLGAYVVKVLQDHAEQAVR